MDSLTQKSFARTPGVWTSWSKPIVIYQHIAAAQYLKGFVLQVFRFLGHHINTIYFFISVFMDFLEQKSFECMDSLTQAGQGQQSKSKAVGSSAIASRVSNIKTMLLQYAGNGSQNMEAIN